MPNSIHCKLYCHSVPSLIDSFLSASPRVFDGGGRNPDTGSRRWTFPSLSIGALFLTLAELVNHLYAAGRGGHLINRMRALAATTKSRSNCTLSGKLGADGRCESAGHQALVLSAATSIGSQLAGQRAIRAALR